MPKVSIIVPVYNTSKYLNKCIDSLINQTEEDIEILLINDGSTDESESIIKEYDDKRIVYIKKKNTGIGKTRNLGIDKAKGEYVMFIDSDDYIDYDCVEKLYNYAIETKSDFVVTDFKKDINGTYEKVIIPDFESSKLIDNPSILNAINLGPCNKIYKKSILKGVRFDEKYKYEDVPFVIKALKNASKISKLNESLSYYVIHEKSQTTVRDEKIFDILEIVNIVRDVLKEDIYHDALVNLLTMVITDYTIQQRYIKNRKSRNKFIDNAFIMLNEIDIKWKKCDYMKNISFIKRYIKTHKPLIKFYCSIYAVFKK